MLMKVYDDFSCVIWKQNQICGRAGKPDSGAIFNWIQNGQTSYGQMGEFGFNSGNILCVSAVDMKKKKKKDS